MCQPIYTGENVIQRNISIGRYVSHEIYRLLRVSPPLHGEWQPPPKQEVTVGMEVEQQFHVDVLSFLNSKHLQHGLRHEDYMRYRRYCSVKLRRLRKSLRRTRRTKQGYHPFLITNEMITNYRYLLVPLFCAERCWSYYMEIRRTDGGDFNRRNFKLRKMRRACYYSEQLLKLAESPKFDIATQYEVRAYYYWTYGNLCIEIKNWTQALDFIMKALYLYEGLLEMCRADTKSVYQARIDELSVTEKYCAYNISGNSDNTDHLRQLHSSLKAASYNSQLAEALAEARSKMAGNVIEITWLNNTFHVYPEKARSFIFRMQSKDKEIQDVSLVHNSNSISGDDAGYSSEENFNIIRKLDLYDNFLLECKDALQQIKELHQGDAKGKSSTEKYGSARDLEQIQNYLISLKLTLSTERNLLILQELWDKYSSNQISSLGTPHSTNTNDASFSIDLKVTHKKSSLSKKTLSTKKTEGNRTNINPENFIRVLDEIIQNIQDFSNLEGVNQCQQLSSLNMSSLHLYKGCRCYFGALLMKVEERYKDGVCLLLRALEHLDNAEHLCLLNYDGMSYIKKQTTVYRERVRALKIEMDMNVITERSIIPEEKLHNQYLIDRLHEKSLDESEMDCPLVPIPCSVQPLPCKPIFYDIAYNYVTWPKIPSPAATTSPQTDSPSSITLNEAAPPPPMHSNMKASGGITGFVKNWLWGSSS